jgi:predicted lysophospholipase L1 biosynthesis ABC-type transport system permease subunit
MATERTNRYWLGVKGLVGLYVGSFVASFAASVVRGVPEDVEPTLETYPLVTALMMLFAVTLVLGALPFCYLVSRDKRELAKEDSDVNRRHWLTVGAFSYFSAGLYPLWYVVVRHRRFDGGDRTIRGVLAPRLRSAYGALGRSAAVARGWYDGVMGRSN